MSEDIFERVSKLIEQFQGTHAKKASSNKQAALDDLREFEVGKRVKPSEFPLSKEMEEVLGEQYPTNPTVEGAGEEDDPQTDVEEAYATNPNPSVSQEEVPDVELRKIEGGQEAMKDASDHALMGKLADAAYTLLYNYALIEPTKTVIKCGAFDKSTVAAYTVADIIKQANYDAEMLAGFLYSIKQAEGNLEEATDVDTTQPESPEEVLASATPEEIAEVLQENPELASALAAQADQAAQAEATQESPEDVLASATPEEIAEVLQENPELASALAAQAGAAEESPEEVLASATPEEIAEVIASDPMLSMALASEVAEEDPLSVLADATPEEIMAVLKEDPTLMDAVKDVMTEIESQETPEDEKTEPPAVQNLEDALGTEQHEDTEDRVDTEPSEKEKTDEVKSSSVLAKIAALSKVMEEEQLDPADLEFYLYGTSKERDAVKVANAVRNFRNRYQNKSIKSADSPALKNQMRKFLQELLVS